MTETLKTISPVDGRIYVERPLEAAAGIDRALDSARRAQAAWAALPLATRCGQILTGKAVDAFVAKTDEIAAEITWQMGRPIRYAPGEVRGFEERARYMLNAAPEALAAIQLGEKAGFERQIKRIPLGIIVVVAPWNYPYLTAVNAVMPALIAGNTVVLKHSHQTPLCAERFLDAFVSAGVPAGVFQYLHLSHADTARLMGDPRVASVCFTGSVSGGRAVVAATAPGFATAGLELGGKDPAYVRADANLTHAIETLTDGAFFNSGQSCCGIKRIYVAASRYREFVDGVVDLTQKYRLGSPLDPETTIGPVVRAAAADAVRAQVQEAVARGARQLIDEKLFASSVRWNALPSTASAGRCRSYDGDHARGNIRTGGWHHECGLRRGGAAADERQRVRTDRRDFLRGRLTRRNLGRCARDGHGIPQSLRLSRSGACLDGC